MNPKIRKLTEAAMITALIGAFLMVDRQFFGAIELVLFWVLPLPLLLYSSKYGFKSGLLVMSAIFFLALLIATPDKVILTIGYCIIGLVYGGSVFNKINRKNILIFTTISFVVFLYCTMFFFALFFGYDIIGERQILSEFFSRIGVLNHLTFTRITAIAFTVLATVPLIIAILQTIVTHLLAVILLKKFNLDNYAIPNIVKMRLSKPKTTALLLVYLLTLILFVFDANLNLTVVVFKINIFVHLLVMAIFMFYGSLCILVIGSDLGKVKPIALALIAIIIPYIAMIIGIWDGLFDLRRKFRRV